MIERAKYILGARTDREMAEKLDVIPSAIAGWKQRGNISFPYLLKIAELTGCSLDWLILGKGYPYGTQAVTMPQLAEDMPQGEKIRRMMDWHIEQLHQLTLLRTREEQE